MKITKYPQSCLKLESENRSLLIDLGTLATAAYSLNDFGDIDAVLFTHSHPDHFDAHMLPELLNRGITCYGNADVNRAANGHAIEVIENGEELLIADFTVKALHLEHCIMVDGSKGVPNTAYLINKTILLPGDSVEDPGFQCKVVAVPIFGPDISFHDAYRFIQTIGAREAVLVHYDRAGMNPKTFSLLGGATAGATVHALDNGTSVELSLS